jgi:hypothetical protein
MADYALYAVDLQNLVAAGRHANTHTELSDLSAAYHRLTAGTRALKATTHDLNRFTSSG